MVSTLTQCAFAFAKSRCLIKDGMCVESAATMWNYVKMHGGNAELRRYTMSDGENGHWTVKTDEGEFDPTIACWDEPSKRAFFPHGFSTQLDVKCGELYQVTTKSPHQAWERDAKIYYDAIMDEIEYE